MAYSHRLNRYLEEHEWEYVSVGRHVSERTFVIADPHFGDGTGHLLKYSAARREIIANPGHETIDDALVDVLSSCARTCHVLKRVFDTFGCSVNIHGHTHEHDVDDPRCINASADELEFTPARIGDLVGRRNVARP